MFVVHEVEAVDGGLSHSDDGSGFAAMLMFSYSGCTVM